MQKNIIQINQKRSNSGSTKMNINPHSRLNAVIETARQILNFALSNSEEGIKQTLEKRNESTRNRNSEIKKQAVTSRIAIKVRSDGESVEESAGSEIIGRGGISGINDVVRTGQRRGNSGPEMRRRE